MSVTAPAGFVAAGLHCGIKDTDAPDLSLVATSDGQPVPAAGVFTQNVACAGPVRVSKEHLTTTNGRAAAVILNSGNANCATGTDVEVAREMCALTAKELGCAPDDVLVCSTGLIGIPVELAPLQRGIPALVQARMADERAGQAAARAIMTTDTVSKQVVAPGEGWTIGGMSKGAAMLAPNMATMLAVLTTDAAVSPDALQRMLGDAVAKSFNRIVVDGCTSTNDTVVLLANGVAGAPDHEAFAATLEEACLSLAMQMVRDAEGHTKVVTVVVDEAATEDEAERAARKLAGSLLVKSSFYGSDPYWGRVLSELGVANIAMDPETVTIAYDNVIVSKGLAPTGENASAVAAQPEFTLTCTLGAGPHRYHVHTNDLTHAYIDENMGTS
jgi:glutamate N-acetyltransferase/amino-acid N-acetyltransferase